MRSGLQYRNTGGRWFYQVLREIVIMLKMGPDWSHIAYEDNEGIKSFHFYFTTQNFNEKIEINITKMNVALKITIETDIIYIACRQNYFIQSLFLWMQWFHFIWKGYFLLPYDNSISDNPHVRIMNLAYSDLLNSNVLTL